MGDVYYTDEIGRCFCKAHRRDSCHKCCFDFVKMNQMTETQAGLRKPPSKIDELIDEQDMLKRGISFMKQQPPRVQVGMRENLMYHKTELARVKKNIRELQPRGYWLRRIILSPLFLLALLLLIVAFIVLILGEEQERQAWAEAPSTLHLYTTNETCKDPSGHVLNCGNCGPCSNVHDIQIYHATPTTLTGIMTSCAIGDLLFHQDAYTCLKERAGMTDGCTECWVLNYRCTTHHCLQTCIKHRLFPFLPSLTPWDSGPLDPCFACDEKFCGPVFVACAGANRRRVGIESDIERDRHLEMCNKVDWDWILSEHTARNGRDDTLVTPIEDSLEANADEGRNGGNVVEAEDIIDFESTEEKDDVGRDSGGTATLEEQRLQQEDSSQLGSSISREETQASNVEKDTNEDASAGVDESTQVDGESTHTTNMEEL